MPCNGWNDDVPVSDAYLKRLEKSKAELEEMLCSACRALVNYNFDFGLNPQLDKWWDKHQKEDQKRELAELKLKQEKEHVTRLLNKPLSELTREDKKLLNKHGLL
jgi:hypothetical protein